MNKITDKQLLIDKVVEAIQDTKGEDIMIFDLSKIENSVAQTFVICTGNSNTQVSAHGTWKEVRIHFGFY